MIGWEDETTIQYEGIATIIGKEQSGMKEIYFDTFTDGKEREKWDDISYICIEPKWIRYSDFREPTRIEEKEFK